MFYAGGFYGGVGFVDAGFYLCALVSYALGDLGEERVGVLRYCRYELCTRVGDIRRSL